MTRTFTLPRSLHINAPPTNRGKLKKKNCEYNMLHTPLSSPPYLHLHLLHVPTQFNSSLTHVENYIVNMYRRRHFSIVFHLSTLSTYLQTCPFYVIFMLLWFSIHGTRFEVRTTSTISPLPPPFAFQQLNTELLTT